jgi:serine/threonine-protein kinase
MRSQDSGGSREKPKSGVETTLSDTDANLGLRRRRSRAFALVLICFLFGAVGAAVFAYRAGIIGGQVAAGSVEDQLARAAEALKHKRWDTPPGDNVRDLTNEGLARWPGDARLIDLRGRAADELVKDALGAKFAGDMANALHLARLAHELDATDTTAQHLVSELEKAAGEVEPSPAPAPLAAPVATTSAAGKPAPSATFPRSTQPSGGGGPVRAVLDASVAKPRVGQQVELVARIVGTPKAQAEDPHFQISGPGGASTRLSAMPEGGLYKATFSFLEPGRYEVSFAAKSDGRAVTTSRTLVAGASGGPAAPTTSGDSPAPPPAPSAKWL